MSDKAVVVFTAKSVAHIVSEEGGTAAWRLDRNHARACVFAVCARNAKADWVEGPEEHRAAFLIGRISDVVPSANATQEDRLKGRWLLQFSEYALVTIPHIWRAQGGRNPVRYSTIDELGIDPTTLDWRPMPKPLNPHKSAPLREPPSPLKPAASASMSGPLTIAQAKEGLALNYEVAPEAVEITIHG